MNTTFKPHELFKGAVALDSNGNPCVIERYFSPLDSFSYCPLEKIDLENSPFIEVSSEETSCRKVYNVKDTRVSLVLEKRIVANKSIKAYNVYIRSVSASNGRTFLRQIQYVHQLQLLVLSLSDKLI